MIFQPRQADVEARLVGQVGAAPDQDHVRVGALEVNVAARVLARDPLRFARGQRDLAVDRERQLQRDSRTAELETGQPAGQGPPRFFAPDSELHLDSRIAKATDALARGARVWV